MAFTFSSMSWVATLMLSDMALMSSVILSTSAWTSWATDLASEPGGCGRRGVHYFFVAKGTFQQQQMLFTFI